MRDESGRLRIKIWIFVSKRSLQHPKADPAIFPELKQSARELAAL